MIAAGCGRRGTHAHKHRWRAETRCHRVSARRSRLCVVPAPVLPPVLVLPLVLAVAVVVAVAVVLVLAPVLVLVLPLVLPLVLALALALVLVLVLVLPPVLVLALPLAVVVGGGWRAGRGGAGPGGRPARRNARSPQKRAVIVFLRADRVSACREASARAWRVRGGRRGPRPDPLGGR